MAQIGNILVEYTRYVMARVNAMCEPVAGMHGVTVKDGFSPEGMVEAFLSDLEKRQWMPTTGAEFEEAEPDPSEDVAIDVDPIVEYCYGLALNESAATPVRLKAAEVVMRWYDAKMYDETIRELDAATHNADGSIMRGF